MIKKYIVLVILIYSASVNAQHWGDSLKVARDAFESKKFELAYEKFLSAQRLAPDHIDLSKDIATSAYRAEDYKVAEQVFQGAAKSDGADAHKKWLNVGNSQLKQENLAGAIESYKNALRQNPNDDKARYNLAQAKRMQKEQESKQKEQNKQEQNKEEKNQDQQQEDAQNDSQNKDSQEEEDKSTNQKENQSKPEGSKQIDKKQAQEAQEAKMTEQRIERMLDELLKEEMDTKHRIERKAIKKGEGASTSGKKW